LHFSQKRELFLFPITTLLPSLIVRHFSICPFESHRSSFVFPSPARAARTVFCSFFVRSLFVLCSFFVRSLFVLCSFFVRLLFVFSSSFVRLLFVFCSSFVYLPVRLAPVRVARTCLCGSHCLLCYDLASVSF